ncbi:hypothetical protein JCM8795_16700 [Hydrogenobaculum acidophilum]
MDSPLDNPLKQIKEKKHYEKYLSEDKKVYIVGIGFSESEKSIIGFGWERIKRY